MGETILPSNFDFIYVAKMKKEVLVMWYNVILVISLFYVIVVWILYRAEQAKIKKEFNVLKEEKGVLNTVNTVLLKDHC
ncbi:hypothetical protein KAJ89_03090 [Candidatus Parcubacteria bacterium]|nr:hypothetical protein [Candidatus Parcubacteria bacterium]